MPQPPLTEAELAALRALDTPSVCNAIEIVAPQRRGYGFTTQPLVCAFEKLPPMVGYACTATTRGTHPADASPALMRERRLEYYRHVSDGPRPGIVVIQDLDEQPGYGAFWGEVNTSIHKGLGCAGVVTNGGIRDLDLCAEGFQLLAGQISVSHAHAHVVDVAVTVTVAGMTVRPGDLVHADRHGAVVLPPDVARRVPEAAALIARREAVLIEASRRPDFDFARLAEAMRRSDDIH